MYEIEFVNHQCLSVMEHVEGKPPWGWPQHEMEKLLDPLTPFGRSRLRYFCFVLFCFDWKKKYMG